jgi:hypothetical protein
MILPQTDKLQIDLFDNSGKHVKEIYSGSAQKNLFDVNANVSDLADGIYSARIIYRDNLITYNVMKGNNIH